MNKLKELRDILISELKADLIEPCLNFGMSTQGAGYNDGIQIAIAKIIEQFNAALLEEENDR